MPEMIRAEGVVNQERNANNKATHDEPKNDAMPLLHTNIISTIVRCSCHVSSPPLLPEIPLQQSLERFPVPRLIAGHFIGSATRCSMHGVMDVLHWKDRLSQVVNMLETLISLLF